MNIVIEKLKERIEKNDINTKGEFDHELREITQELVMAGLSSTDLFSKAAFHGGTSLRLLYRINRYSEDLDFTLDKSDLQFKWEPYINEVKIFVEQYGCFLEIKDTSKNDNPVKKAFIKDSSIEQMMNMSWTLKSDTPQKINIKLEMDANPPMYAENEIISYNYPCEYFIKVQKLSSLFAGKCHALLCREYYKGRDWFDFDWFVNKGIEPNYKYLSSMLNQQGPWKEKSIEVNKIWLCEELIKKSKIIDFDEINKDIKRFTHKGINMSLNEKTIKKLIDIIMLSNYGV
jgi:predicted nucleotidyltransferase component of viral defense system